MIWGHAKKYISMEKHRPASENHESARESQQSAVKIEHPALEIQQAAVKIEFSAAVFYVTVKNASRSARTEREMVGKHPGKQNHRQIMQFMIE
jgi:hypothetical protein